MRLVGVLLGVGLIFVGVLVFCGYADLAYPFGRANLEGMPSHYYWGPVLCAVMAGWGSFLTVLAFRGDGGGWAVDVGGRSWARGAAVFVLLLQIGLLGVQAYQLWRYDEMVRPHMPSMAREGDAAVVGTFYLWTAGVPFAAQLFLVPAVWALARYAMRDSLRGGAAAAGTVWMAALSWFGAFMAVGLGIVAFD